EAGLVASAQAHVERELLEARDRNGEARWLAVDPHPRLEPERIHLVLPDPVAGEEPRIGGGLADRGRLVGVQPQARRDPQVVAQPEGKVRPGSGGGHVEGRSQIPDLVLARSEPDGRTPPVQIDSAAEGHLLRERSDPLQPGLDAVGPSAEVPVAEDVGAQAEAIAVESWAHPLAVAEV